jgi:hypothetical protein
MSNTSKTVKAFSEKKIIEMCAVHEGNTNVRDVDKKFYIEFWNKAIDRRAYCGRQGLWTIMGSYIDKVLLKDGGTEKERAKLEKKYRARLPDWQDENTKRY